jgi:hypothetical protein
MVRKRAAEPMKEDEEQQMRQNASQCAFADGNVTDKQQAEIAGL